LRYIIETLVDSDSYEAAVPFFKRYQASDAGSPTVKILEFLVSCKRDELSVALSKGKAVLQSGIKDPLVYRYMIECSAKAGLNDLARDLSALASREFPAKQKEYESVLTAFIKEKSAAAPSKAAAS
jgi:hypothetical protein